MGHRPAALLLTTTAAISLMTGCASDDTDPAAAPAAEETSASATDPAPESDSATSDPQPSSTDDPTSDIPPFPTGTERDSSRWSGRKPLVLVDLRVGENEGFDRVVLEFRGEPAPGWGVGYEDEAVLEGSGDVVPLDGDAVLRVDASSVTFTAPDYYDGPRRLPLEGDGPVEEVYLGGTFEGYTTVFAGVDGDRAPFRVFALTSPTRLVIDVEDAG